MKLFTEHVTKEEPMKCGLNNCEGLVKPDIVFFGEALPLTFS
jgi:NAD-dependent SIR2 family protein deacetylase